MKRCIQHSYHCAVKKKEVNGMCEYCEEPTKNIQFRRQNSDSNISECFIHEASDGAALFLRQEFVVKLTDGHKPQINQLNDYVYVDINFCPMCGRKLVQRR